MQNLSKIECFDVDLEFIKMQDINSLNIQYFNKMNIFFSNETISYIWNNADDICKFYKIEKNKFINSFKVSNEETKKKIIKYVDVKYLCYIYVNDLYSYKSIWDNKILINNILENIHQLYDNNILKNVIIYLDNIKFKKIIYELDFYYLEDVYHSIKYDKEKLKIFINGINLSYIELLIHKMDDNIVDFIGLNLNYIHRLELLSRIFVTNLEEIPNLELSRLQIILLIETSYEKAILNNLIKYEVNFIKKIINKLNENNFKIFFYSMKIDVYYQLIEYICYNKLQLVVNESTNQIILREILTRIKFNDINSFISKLSMEQIISSTYELCDEKIILIAKSLTLRHKIYLENLFNRISPNQINYDIPKISKQLICYIYTCSSIKPYIINNLHNLNNNKVILLTNLMNGDDIYNLLKNLDFKNKSYILSNINKELILSLSNVIDRKIDVLVIKENISGNLKNDIILIKLINVFVNLRLSPKNKYKLDQF